MKGQQTRFFFEKNNFDEELVYDQIEDILFDRDGFTWLATSTGLYMYDGYEFSTFIHNSTSNNSLSENFATTLFEDSKGKIWVGTYNSGLNVFDKEYNSFYNFLHNPKDSTTLTSNKIPRGRNVITEDKHGFVWVTTDNGLNRIDAQTKTVKRYPGDFHGQVIYHPDEDMFWIAGENLKRFNPSGKSTETFNVFDKGTFVTGIFLSSDGFLFLGTNSGMRIFDTREKKLITFNAVFRKKSSTASPWDTNKIEALYEDFHKDIWIGTGKDVYVLNRSTGNVTALKNGTENEKGILGENVRGIYGDNKGVVLITYESRGITKINLNLKNFKHITQVSSSKSGAGGNNVRSIYQDKNNDLWIGTYNHGLNRILSGGGIVSYLHSPGDMNSLSSNYITAIYVDSRDRLWIGTLENGFCFADDFLSPGRLSFTRSNFEEKVEIHEFTEDEMGRIWISTDLGFFIYDRATEKIVHYGDAANQVKEVRDINIQSVIVDEPGVFWFASWNKGVGKLIVNGDPVNVTENRQDSLILYDEIKDRVGNPLDNRFINILKDRNHRIWLASSVNGLIKMDVGGIKPAFTKYDVNRGAPANIIYAIVEDNEGMIWVSTRNGIGKFNPQKEQFQNFYESDGLLSNSFIWDSYFQGCGGEVFFGGINGLSAFFPDSIDDNVIHPNAYFSKLIINHNEIKIGEVIDDRVLLNKSLRFTKSILLTHKESNFSVAFSANNIVNHNEILFSYKLEGFDHDWINTSTGNPIVTYTNLKPGTYFLHVRATKNLGQWDGGTATLKIIVVPPWWRTWWAYALYFIFIAGILYLVQREIVKRSELKHRLSLEEYKHERDNELNKEKFSFFTNLSHELRTPLTLILGPLDRMIEKNEGNNRLQQNLQLIQKQALRLQKLTNQIMDFRKYEIDNLKLRTAEGNVIDFLQEITLAFRHHARMKRVHFNFEHKEDTLKLFYDRDKFEIIVVNLLSNAFKFTPQDGKVTLKISQVQVDQVDKVLGNIKGMPFARLGEFSKLTKRVAQIEVSDTGIGINPQQLNHIFERYFQASNIRANSVAGTGIGLEITKNYVELHKGSIIVTSREGAGTTFYIWLPLGKDHLTDDDVIEDFKPSDDKIHYIAEGTERIKYEDILSTEEVAAPKNGMPTVMIVDDNPDIVLFLKENFENSFHVVTARDGKEGLDMAFEQIPDIIISDIMMPKIDGLEFCKEIKTDIRTSHIPVILLTARTSNIFQAEGLETGADDYVTKPFDERLLNIRVRNLIESRKQLRKRYSKEISLSPRDITVTSPDEKFLNKVVDIIEKNIADSDMKVEWIAREVGMSHSVLYKKILALTDLTVIEFVRTIRLKRAAQILLKTDYPIAQVSSEVGFADPKYFSKSFQTYYGCTPTDYRRDRSI